MKLIVPGAWSDCPSSDVESVGTRVLECLSEESSTVHRRQLGIVCARTTSERRGVCVIACSLNLRVLHAGTLSRAHGECQTVRSIVTNLSPPWTK